MSVPIAVGPPSQPWTLLPGLMPSFRFFRQCLSGVRQNLNILSRLWLAAIRCHSPLTLSKPRSRKRRSPLTSLICPYIVAKKYSLTLGVDPVSLATELRVIRFLASASLGIATRHEPLVPTYQSSRPFERRWREPFHLIGECSDS